LAGATEQPAALPPAGSPRWYAWLFTPRHTRGTPARLFALESELRSIVTSQVDHGVTHLKLQWWRDEVLRLVQGSPRHPLTQALARQVPDRGPAWRPLTDFLTSLELELAAVAIDDDTELERFLALADGLMRALALALGHPANADLLRIGSDTGQAIRGVQIVADWSKTPMDEERRAIVMQLAARSRARWEQASEAIAASRDEALRGLRVLGQLHMSMLDRIEIEQYRADRRRLELTAWQSLWTAWHAARQH
jgi:15-cis-phytoene synthase